MKNLILFFMLLLSFYSFSQEQKKDTLFIEYENSLLTKFQYPGDDNIYYRIKGTGNDGFTYFMKGEVYTYLKAKKKLCFKNVLKKSNAYYKKGKLVDSKLAEYLGKHVIFLIKENEYINVIVVEEIE